jgi:cytohesin
MYGRELKVKPNQLLCVVLLPMLLSGACRKKPAPTTSPLHWAAKTGDVQQIQEQLSRGDDVNAKDQDGWTALHWAAQEGHRDAAKLLISKGAAVNAADKDGWTPIFLALGEEHTDVVALLAASGADVNVKCGQHQETPLHYAVREGQRETVQVLISYGADVNRHSQGGMTPLHSAVSQRQKDIVELLLAAGADVNAKGDWNAETPLCSADVNLAEVLSQMRPAPRDAAPLCSA